MKIFYSLFSLLLLTSFLRADLSTEEILAKAREFLGGDEALEKITSIHYEGGFETAEGESGTIDIIFEKPLKQRIRITNNGVGEITALDDFDGWRKRYDLENEDKWSLQMLDNAKIRELQANTWENLNFFKGIEERRGSIENHGKAEIDGHETVKLVFKHPASIQFTRFFDIETGRLLLTKTHEGSEVREEGEIYVDGILFPEKITMSKEGKVLNEIRFEKITLNKSFESREFSFPALRH